MSSLEKQCTKCKQILPVTSFYKDKYSSDKLTSSCKKCTTERHKRWYENGGAQKNQLYVKANPIKRITSTLMRGARNRAKDKNLPLDIDLDYIRLMVGENAELASHCPIFGIPLDWSCMRNNGGRVLPNSPSLDRIDPQRGYVKGNVWIISYRANAIKNDATHEELKLVTKAVGEAIVNSLEF